jgi:2-hydroxy-3-oxopropionate reductase
MISASIFEMDAATDEPVGMVGLGKMGMPMLRQLVRSGRRVIAMARTESRASEARAAGAETVDSVALLAAEVRVVLISVPADADVEAICLGPTGLAALLAPGSLVVDTSTISPAAARQLAGAFHERGIEFVDAPVSGGPGGVEQATLAVMAGGEPASLDRAEVLVAPFAGRFVRCGPSGSGQVAKACNQLVVATTLQVVSEALVLAQAAGADVHAVREALLGGFAFSRILELQGLRMIERDFAPRGTVSMQRKDIRVIQELAAQSGVKHLPAFEAAAAAVGRLDDGGGGALDHSALITVCEHDSEVFLGATPNEISLTSTERQAQETTQP